MVDVSNPFYFLLGIIALVMMGLFAVFCLIFVATQVYILLNSEFNRWRPIVSILVMVGFIMMMAYVIYPTLR